MSVKEAHEAADRWRVQREAGATAAAGAWLCTDTADGPNDTESMQIDGDNRAVISRVLSKLQD
jgi:hypothetical protein